MARAQGCVLYTRSQRSGARLRSMLAGSGIALVADPAIRVDYAPCEPPQDARARLEGAVMAADALVFTSANAPRALRWLGVKCCARAVFCIGEMTRLAAKEWLDWAGSGGVSVSDFAGDGTPVRLVEIIAQGLEVPSRVLHIGGDMMRGHIGSALRGLGYDYSAQVVYRVTANPQLTAAALRALKSGDTAAQLFYSVFALRSHVARCDLAGVDWRGVPAVCLSSPIADAARELGAGAVTVAARVDERAMAAAVLELLGIAASSGGGGGGGVESGIAIELSSQTLSPEQSNGT